MAAMTNEQIILNHSIALMNDGIIKGTGNFLDFTYVNGEGEEVTEKLEVPEAIHTYAVWKKLGRQVKRGEKAKAQFEIWQKSKRTAEVTTTNEAGQEVTETVDTGRFFLKTTFFFTLDQTEVIA